MWKCLLKTFKVSSSKEWKHSSQQGQQGTPQLVHGGNGGLLTPGTADKAPKGVEGVAGTGSTGPVGAMEGAPHAIKDVTSARPAKPVGACPSYAAKSVVGQRMTMEDSWQAVPDLVVIPKWWTLITADQLPAIPQSQPDGTTSAQPAAGEAGQITSPTSDAPAAASDTRKSEEGSVATAPAARPVSAANGLDNEHAPVRQGHGQGPEAIPVHFFAVYDGHGGPDVAKHCAKSLHEHLKAVVAASSHPADAAPATPAGPAASSSPSEAPAATAPPAATEETGGAAETWPVRVDGMEAALKAAFLRTDQQLAQNRSAHEVGTTAVVTLVTARHLWVGNCGDSRALLCREAEAVALSLDHKATRADEVSRVEQAGGYVWWDRVMGELAVSRAIGDHCLRPFVIADPEVTTVLRRQTDQVLIMASDGLWDVFTNEEARQLALEKFHGELGRTSSSKLAVKKVASSLAKAAIAKGSRDNVTVVVVDVRVSGRVGHHGTSSRTSASATAAAVAVATAAGAGGGSGAAAAGGGTPDTAEAEGEGGQLRSPHTPGGSDEDEA